MQTKTKQPLLDKIGNLVETRIGIAPSRHSADALAEVVQTLGGSDLSAYLKALESAKDTDDIWQRLIDALTIGETYFLRDKVHFQLLRETIFPELIGQNRSSRSLNIWSVGCASGEEPYSLAITLYELLPDIASWKINIIGSDINARSLRTARRGVYRKWAFRHTDIDFQGRYFDPSPDGLQIKPMIQNMVTFRQLNLFEKPPQAAFNLILCRNVLIYFGREHTRHSEDILYEALVPGGWMLLGHSETIQFSPERWINGRFPSTPAFQKPLVSGGTKRKTLTGSLKRKTLTAELVRVDIEAPSLPATYAQAVKAVHEEDYALAEVICNKLIAKNPDHGAAHTLLAFVYANRNQMDKAQKYIDSALYNDPLLADAHYLRALLYIEQQRRDDARKSLIAAIYCQRHHPLASYTLGNICAKEGDITRAMLYWQNTLDAITGLGDDMLVSDISTMNARQLRGLVAEQLKGWT